MPTTRRGGGRRLDNQKQDPAGAGGGGRVGRAGSGHQRTGDGVIRHHAGGRVKHARTQRGYGGDTAPPPPPFAGHRLASPALTGTTHDRADLAAYVAANLPLAGAMGVEVLDAGEDRVRLRVPLGPNLNHERTAFGGSLAAAGMLAGWGLLWVRARRLDPAPRLVIAEGQMRFIRPVRGDFEAACEWPRPDAWQAALDRLVATGRARVPLRSELTYAGKVAAAHAGTFVLIRRDGLAPDAGESDRPHR